MSCTSSDIDKTFAKFQKRSYYLKRKEEFRSQDTHCLYALVEVKPKND